MASIGDSQDGKVVQFMSVTGTDNARAQFYLQAAAWNLEVGSVVKLLASFP